MKWISWIIISGGIWAHSLGWCWLMGSVMILAVLLVIVLLRSFYERSHLVVSHYDVDSKKLPLSFEGYKIAVIADLHGNMLGKENELLLDAIRREAPDIVVIAGDGMVVKKPDALKLHALECVLQGIRGLNIPVYYGKGNHEERMKQNPERYPGWYEQFLHLLAEYGVTLLENTSLYVAKGEEAIRLTGYDIPPEYYRKKFVVLPMDEKTITGDVGESDGNCYQILLAHSPLYAAAYAQWGADLIISGHFHGGTIRLPVLGGLMSPQFQFFSGYDRGCYQLGEGVYQVTSGGLGTHSINLRLNNMSELPVICLHRKTI